MVVLMLHIVAVGGIYAFNAIKAHQTPAFEDPEISQPQAQTSAASNPAVDTPATPAPSAAFDVVSCEEWRYHREDRQYLRRHRDRKISSA